MIRIIIVVARAAGGLLVNKDARVRSYCIYAVVWILLCSNLELEQFDILLSGVSSVPGPRFDTTIDRYLCSEGGVNLNTRRNSRGQGSAMRTWIECSFRGAEVLSVLSAERNIPLCSRLYAEPRSDWSIR